MHRGLKALSQARKAITEALGIMDELGLQEDEQCGSMLLVLGSSDHLQGRQEEALAIYNKAKAVLVHSKERPDYGALSSNMADCLEQLSQRNEASCAPRKRRAPRGKAGKHGKIDTKNKTLCLCSIKCFH